MARLTLTLPDDLQEKLQARASRAGRATVEEHIAALVRADVEASEGVDGGGGDEDHGAPAPQSVALTAELEARLLDGLRSPAREMTDADWDAKLRRFHERRAAGGTR